MAFLSGSLGVAAAGTALGYSAIAAAGIGISLTVSGVSTMLSPKPKSQKVMSKMVILLVKVLAAQ